MADTEYLASYAVDIDEAGVARLQRILEQNNTLAASVTSAFNSASDSIDKFKEKIDVGLSSLYAKSGVAGAVEGARSGITLSLDMTEANAELDAFVKKASKPVALTANASGITSAARSALENVRSMFATTFFLNVTANTNYDSRNSDDDEDRNKFSGKAAFRMSTGGRFTKPTSVEVAEDGDAEYIIPVKKESRALPLLRQLLGEISPEARMSLLNSAGTATSGVKASTSSIGPAPAPATQNNSNVSAPVTINVNASGSDATRIGQSVYNTAERYLLRTMKGALA